MKPGKEQVGAAEVGSTANNYQILAKLAAGGMAEIFLARGASVAGVERYVVLKRILPERASDVHFVQMFLDEARLAAQLQHPNIAQVFDIGKLGDSYFFTMEYVHGETVRALLARGYALQRQLPLGAVMTIVAQAASGLNHAHERIGIDGRPLGIVHRDVTPSNLIVSFEGNVKVVDFGVAKAADRMQETQAGTVKGKIAYLSPEQCKGSGIDRRSDLYALGIVMWEMLTGERLYRRDSDFENMTAIVTEEPPPPSSLRPELPPVIDAVVMRLLDKRPDQRFQTCEAVVEAIEEAALRTRATLSVTALARLMRELFGQRPEPWIELRAIADAPPEAVTVTSEPVPAQIVAVPLDAVRAQLASVIDLSSHRARVTQGLPVALPVVRPVPLSISAPREAPAVITLPVPTSLAVNELPSAEPSSRPIWPIVLAILVAAGLGAGAVWLTMRSTTPPLQLVDTSIRTTTDASFSSAIQSALADATPSPSPSPLREGALREGALREGADDAAVEPPDAAIANEPDDAMPAAIEVVDAGDAAPVDAQPAVDAASASRDPIGDAVESGDYATAVKLCRAEPMTTKRATVCTAAACKAGIAATARNWFAFAPANRKASTSAICKAAGIALDQKRVVPPPPPPPRRIDAGVVDCVADPLACQH